MKKLLTLVLTTTAFGAFSQTNLHDAKILGSISIGNQEITSVLDETTGCNHKSTLHTKNLFIVGENVKLDIKENGNQSKIIKPNLPEIVFVDKCNGGNPKDEFQMTEVEFKENVAFLDAKVRSINQNKHAREITLLDFSNHDFGKLKKRIINNNVKFNDEGTGHDQIANDGIYTSLKLFNNGNNHNFQYIGESIRVLSNPIVDPTFKHQTELNQIIDDSNSDPNNPFKFGFSVSCDFDFSGPDCAATDLGFCSNCCLSLTNCSFTANWN